MKHRLFEFNNMSRGAGSATAWAPHTRKSANPDYDDIEIDRADIRGLYLVESVINFDIRC